jgi:hypothetical protein
MVRGRKYPLDPLARLREKQVGDATRLLSDAIRARQEAERGLVVVLSRKNDAEAHARALGDRERNALERGELRADDLARAAAWSVRVETDRADLERRLAKAVEGAQAAHGGESNAQGEFARARADAEVVARDRAKWEDTRRKKDEAAEEEAGAEAFRPKSS